MCWRGCSGYDCFEWNGLSAVAWAKMNIHRSAHVHDTRREQRKEATTRTGATAPTERLRRQGATHQKGSKTKSPFCVILKTYHLTGNQNKTCLKHSNFLNRKLCVQLLPTWNTMATARGQGTEGKTKYAKTSWDKVQNTAITTKLVNSLSCKKVEITSNWLKELKEFRDVRSVKTV